MEKKRYLVGICAFLIAALLLLAGCGTGTSGGETAVSKEQKESLEKGEMFKSQGNYQDAIDAFKNAGEPGQDSLKQTILEYAAKANYFEYGTAAGYLAESIPDLISADEGYPVLEELLTKWSIQAADFNLEDLDTFEREDRIKEFNAAYEMIAACAEDMNANGYDVTELLNDLYFTWGRKSTSLEKRLEMWSRAGEGSDAHTIMEAIELVKSGELIKGVEMLAQVATEENKVTYLYNYAVDIYWQTEPESVNDKLERRYEAARARELLNEIEPNPEYGILQPEDPVELDRFLNDVLVLAGIDEIEDNEPMTDAERQDIETLCGTEPDGKMLILHKRQLYDSDGFTTDVDLYHMEMMPDEFYPNSLKEVEFVVLLETTYVHTGRTYSEGTKEIRETTKLTLYDAVTGETLYTASAQSTPKTYLYYSGEVPVYHSGESPVMNDAMLQVMEKIRSLKRNQ